MNSHHPMQQLVLNVLLHNYKKLTGVFALIACENIAYLLYPLIAGESINAVLNHDVGKAVAYALVILNMWVFGAIRRRTDTRVFSGIYAKLAVDTVISQRNHGHALSTISARTALSAELVDFFESTIPACITSMAYLVGAMSMLFLFQPLAGLACMIGLLISLLMLPTYVRKNDEYYLRLHDRLEKSVAMINECRPDSLNRHYDFLRKIQVCLSDREAMAYLYIGIVACLLFAVTIFQMAREEAIDGGHVYSVLHYLWMFVTSLDNLPWILKKYSTLKDICQRINAEMPNEACGEAA